MEEQNTKAEQWNESSDEEEQTIGFVSFDEMIRELRC